MNTYTITVCRAAEDVVVFFGKLSAENDQAARIDGRVFVDGLAKLDAAYDVRMSDRWGNEIGNWSV